MFKFLSKHLREINESYFTHMRHALYFSAVSFFSSIALLIHSFFPFIFITTGSNNLKKLYNIMSLRVKILKQNCANIRRVAIVGFGASGIISFYNLVKKHEGENLLEIEIFDRNIGINKGMAYATKNINHLLNVRAKNMSALQDEPEHFVNWLKKNGYEFGAQDFAPRAIYNIYLDDIIARAFAIADSKKISYKFIHHDVEKIAREKDYFIIENEAYNYCLLCVGGEMINLEKNFWHINFQKYLPNKEIHILGSGLTALDAVTSFVDAGYDGKIFLHSRSTRLPQENLVHKIHDAKAPLSLEDCALPMSEIFKKFTSSCKNSTDWRAVFDAMRATSSQFWQGLSVDKKRRFLRHCLRLWNVHRHRAPSKQYQKIQDLIASGKVILTKEKIVGDFIDCRGFDFARKSPLIANLIENKIAVFDEVNLGISALDKKFIIIGANNFGNLFETTAVPELRKQGFEVEINC